MMKPANKRSKEAWLYRLLAFQLDHYNGFVFINCAVKMHENHFHLVMTQYGIKHIRMYPGRSAKCYVNPLNDLFRLPTITIQRWLAADTGAHLSFCPSVPLRGAPYCERRGVGCPVALVANGWSQHGSSHGNDAGRCNNVRFVSCFTPPLGFCPTYNPVHETQREASHACPSEFQHCSAQTISFVTFTQQLEVAFGLVHNVSLSLWL